MEVHYSIYGFNYNDFQYFCGLWSGEILEHLMCVQRSNSPSPTETQAPAEYLYYPIATSCVGPRNGYLFYDKEDREWTVTARFAFSVKAKPMGIGVRRVISDGARNIHPNFRGHDVPHSDRYHYHTWLRRKGKKVKSLWTQDFEEFVLQMHYGPPQMRLPSYYHY